MAHQRFEEIGEEVVEKRPGFREDAAVVNVIVKHECEGAGVPYCHQQMCDPMEVVE